MGELSELLFFDTFAHENSEVCIFYVFKLFMSVATAVVGVELGPSAVSQASICDGGEDYSFRGSSPS